MFTLKTSAKGIAWRWPLVVQGVLVLGVLLASLSPLSGAAALYVPLGSATQAQSIAWAKRHGGTLLGPGPLPGSIMIAGPAATDLAAAVRDGALLIAIPASLCGQSATAARSPNNVYR